MRSTRTVARRGNAEDNYHNMQGGTPAAPVMEVYGNAVLIANGDATPSSGDHTDFGVATVGSTVDRIFTITNTGDGNLTSISVSVPTGFTLQDAPDATIAALGNSTFTVRASAASEAEFSGSVTISSNELADYIFAITVDVFANIVLNATDLLYSLFAGHGGAANPKLFSDAGVTQIVDGGSVHQWTAENTALSPVQATDTLRPTYRQSVAGLNNRGAVEFDGGDWLQVGSGVLSLQASWTWAVVVKTTHAAGGTIVSEGRSSSNTPFIRFDTNGANGVGNIRNNVGAAVGLISSSTINDGNKHLLVFTLIGTTLSLYVDNLVTPQATDTMVAAPLTTDRLTFGGLGRAAVSEIWDGQIPLCVAWSGDHVADCQAIKDYYGIA